MKIKPINHILIEPIQNKTSSIILTTDKPKPTQIGKIIKLPNKNKELKVNDTVLFSLLDPIEITIKNKKYLFVKQENILLKYKAQKLTIKHSSESDKAKLLQPYNNENKRNQTFERLYGSIEDIALQTKQARTSNLYD